MAPEETGHLKFSLSLATWIRVWYRTAMPRTASLPLSILIALAMIACAPQPSPTPEPAADLQGVSELLILHKGASSLGFYSPAGEQLGVVPVGKHPHEMVLSADGKQVYNTDNGTMAIEVEGSGGNTVSITDIDSRERVGVIDLGEFHRPHGIDLDPNSGLVYVSTENPDQLVVVDPAERKVVRTYDTRGETAHMVKLGPEYKWAYVSHSNSGNVGAVNLETGEVKLIEAGNRPEGSDLSPDGKLLYVVNRESAEITIIDTATQEAVGSISTGNGPVRLKAAPDGAIVYALMHDSAVGFADPVKREQVATVSLGGQPVSLDLSEDGRYAFASAQDIHTVYVVSVADRQLVKEIRVPDGMFPDPVIALP